MNASHSTQDALRLDRLVHVETVCPKNGNLNGENMGNSWSTKSTGFGKVWSRRLWSICRSMSHDKIKTTASTTFEGNTPKSRTTARHPNNCGLRTTKYHKAHRGTPAFHTNTGLASYTIYRSFTIIYLLVVSWWVSGKQNLDQQEEVSRTGLRIIWWSEPEAAVAKPKARVLRSVAHPWRQRECPLKDVNIQQMHLHFVNCLLLHIIAMFVH